jgi:UDP-glucose 4-epimerase
MKILVTGANGFLGKTMIQELVRRLSGKIYIYGLSRTDNKFDHSSYVHVQVLNNKFTEAVASINPDVVFHFAGNPMVNARDGLIEDNAILTDRILRGCGASNFIYASSASIYGSACPPNGFSETDTPNPESIYAVTKLQGEDLVKFYTKKTGLKGLSIRYVATVGRNATHGVLPDVIRKLKEDPNEIELFGEAPGSIKPYLWADQSMSKTLDLGLMSLPSYDVLNMSPRDQLSIDELVDEVLESKNLSPVKKKWAPQYAWAGDQTDLRVSCRFPDLMSSRMAIRAALGEI